MAANLDGLERRIERLEARLDARISSGAEYTTLARSSSAGDKDQVDVAGSSEGQKSDHQRPVQRMHPWGFAGRPPAGVFVGLVKAVANAFNGLFFGQWSDKYGPGKTNLPELEEGETLIYCKEDGTKIYLDKDGKIHVDAATGQDVIVNGGTKKVARVDDTADGGTLLFVAGSGGASLSYFGPGVPPVGVGTPIALSAKINSGADNFKG